MPVGFIIAFSVIIYGGIIWVLCKKRELLDFSRWPANRTLLGIWVIWILSLVLLASLSFINDMNIWVGSIIALLQKMYLTFGYVYLPVYSEVLTALAWPFIFTGIAGITSYSFLMFLIHFVVIFAYVYCAKLMSELIPSQSEIAPLGIVLAPVTILYTIMGINHIVMFLLLLASLVLIKKERFIWGGFFGFLSCYKFMSAPTLIVLSIIILWRYGSKKAALFVLGGVISLVPSLIYYCYDPGTLLMILERKANIGGHSKDIDIFSIFYLLSKYKPGFSNWYIGKNVWFYLSMMGVPLSLLLYRRKRLNIFQSLALSYGFVAVFALEPLRLEPLVGLLWLDAVYRKDLRVQVGIFTILSIHAIAWYDSGRILNLYADAPWFLWQGKGLCLGLAVIIVLLMVVFEKDKRDIMFDDTLKA